MSDLAERHENVVGSVASFSPLYKSGAVNTEEVFSNEVVSNWNCFDYDETGGRVVLGSTYGVLTVVHL